MTDDLIAFCRARLDEREAAAKAAARAHPGPWSHDEHSGLLPAARDVSDAKGGPVAVVNGSYLADHITLCDPAWVLRDVEAKRAILDTVEFWSENDQDAMAFVARQLAAIDRDHPDYNPAWEPRP